MEVAQFCSTSHVVIVAGKGGVGKTTVTAALAVAAARAGSSVLVVEIEGKSGLATMFGVEALSYDELDLDSGIRARFLTPDAALVDYLVSHGMKRISSSDLTLPKTRMSFMPGTAVDTTSRAPDAISRFEMRFMRWDTK